MSRHRVWGIYTLFLLVVGCSFLEGQVSLQQPASADDEALSTDPSRPPEKDTESTVAPWQWSDGAQRWISAGRATPPRLPPDAWVFEPASTSVRIVAAPQLNWFDQRPHSVVVKVMQLSDTLAFERNRQAPFALQELLAGKAVDPSILDSRTVPIDPGADTVLTVDRLEQARYVGIVVGFFDLNGRQSARMIPIPPVQEVSSENKWINRLTFGWWGQGDAVARPARLKILLRLGQSGIDEMRVLSR